MEHCVALYDKGIEKKSAWTVKNEGLKALRNVRKKGIEAVEDVYNLVEHLVKRFQNRIFVTLGMVKPNDKRPLKEITLIWKVPTIWKQTICHD